MMEDYTLPFWIYLAVLTVFVGGAMKTILASHLSAAPPLVAWLGATVLVEQLWELCLPAVLLLALLGLTCCLYSAARTNTPYATLTTHDKAVFITGRNRLRPRPQKCVFAPEISSVFILKQLFSSVGVCEKFKHSDVRVS